MQRRMDKFALMIGVSQCEEGELPPLRKARTNVEVLKRSLQSTNAGFEVQTLWDTPQLEMAETIEQFFRHRDGDDQIFFTFSGYAFKDVDDQLYLATPSTLIDDWGQLVRARTIPMRFLVNVTEPLLGPLRRIIPPLGVMDISPIFAFLLLWLIKAAIQGTLLRGGSPLG